MNKVLLYILFPLLVITDSVSGQSTAEIYKDYVSILEAFLLEYQIDKRDIVLENISTDQLEIVGRNNWDSTIIRLSYILERAARDTIVFDKRLKGNKFKVSIVTKDYLHTLFAEDVQQGWKTFYKQNPGSGGLVRMSRMVLEPGHRRGLIYISILRGPLNGGGYLVYFDLSDKKIVKKMQGLWQA
jgi:hypothetical protein